MKDEPGDELTYLMAMNRPHERLKRTQVNRPSDKVKTFHTPDSVALRFVEAPFRWQSHKKTCRHADISHRMTDFLVIKNSLEGSDRYSCDSQRIRSSL